MSPSAEDLRAIALDEFATAGYLGTSLHRIADLAGLSKSSVLYHYASKEVLLGAAIGPALDAMDAHPRRARGRAADPHRRRTFIVQFVDFLLEHRLEVHMFINQGPSLVDVPVVERANALVRRLAQYFATHDHLDGGPDAFRRRPRRRRVHARGHAKASNSSPSPSTRPEPPSSTSSPSFWPRSTSHRTRTQLPEGPSRGHPALPSWTFLLSQRLEGDRRLDSAARRHPRRQRRARRADAGVLRDSRHASRKTRSTGWRRCSRRSPAPAPRR